MTLDENIKQALRVSYKNLNQEHLNKLSKEIVFAPMNRQIDLDSAKISASDLRYQIATAFEDSQSAKFSDLNTLLASSIENLNAQTNSSHEYFKWLQDCSEIIKNMNDGFVSQDDLKERNAFLEMSDQRESELMLCLGLYAASTHPKAKEHAALLRYKLERLRQMRSAIETLTREEADTKISKEEYEKALPYYKLFKSLGKQGFGEKTPLDPKLFADISHEKDPDLQADYDYHARLLNEALDALNAQEQTNYNILDKKKEEISDKLKELAGRRKTFRLSYVILKNKQEHTFEH